MPTLPRNMLNICAFLVNLKLRTFFSIDIQDLVVHPQNDLLFTICFHLVEGCTEKNCFSVNQGDAAKLSEKCNPCFISLWTIVWVHMLLKRAFHWFLFKNFQKHVHRCTKNYLFLHMGYLAIRNWEFCNVYSWTGNKGHYMNFNLQIIFIQLNVSLYYSCKLTLLLSLMSTGLFL